MSETSTSDSDDVIEAELVDSVPAHDALGKVGEDAAAARHAAEFAARGVGDTHSRIDSVGAGVTQAQVSAEGARTEAHDARIAAEGAQTAGTEARDAAQDTRQSVDQLGRRVDQGFTGVERGIAGINRDIVDTRIEMGTANLQNQQLLTAVAQGVGQITMRLGLGGIGNGNVGFTPIRYTPKKALDLLRSYHAKGADEDAYTIPNLPGLGTVVLPGHTQGKHKPRGLNRQIRMPRDVGAYGVALTYPAGTPEARQWQWNNAGNTGPMPLDLGPGRDDLMIPGMYHSPRRGHAPPAATPGVTRDVVVLPKPRGV